MTYEIPREEVGSGQKQRNVPVWSIDGQYSPGLPADPGREAEAEAQEVAAEARGVPGADRRTAAPGVVAPAATAANAGQAR